MIYLIGGPPKCAKTTLAKRFSKTASIPWVSSDTLQNVIKPYIPEQDFAANFPSSSMRYDSNDEKYAQQTTEEIVGAYRQQAKTVYDAIESFVASEIADGNDYIIEGFHVEPELIARLTSQFPDQVRGVLVVKIDAKLFIEDINKSTTPNDWIHTRTKDNPITFPKIAAMVSEYSQQLKAEAQRYDLKVLEFDHDFDDQLEVAIGYLTNKA